MKKTLIVIAVLTLSLGIYAQENVIKTSPLGFTYGKYNLQYERVLTDYTSANISVSHLRPNLFGLEDLLNTLMDLGVMEDWSLAGAAINIDYRVYSKNKKGPRGFYIAPYIRYGNLGFSQTTNVNTTLYDDEGNATTIDQLKTGIAVSRYGFGLKLGSQWLIKDKFSIDWNFGGLGADLYHSVIYSDISTNQNPVQDIAKDSFWKYAFSTSFSIGYAF